MPILPVRAARRAILESPAHPQGYLSLSFAYLFSNFDGPLAASKEFIVAATLERFFARTTLEQLAASGEQSYQAARLLANLHFDNLQYLEIAEIRRLIHSRHIEFRADQGLAALKKARFILVLSPQLQAHERFQNEVKALDALIQRWEEEVRNQENRWLNKVVGDPTPLGRAVDAKEFWLYNKSIEELKKINLEDDSQISFEKRIAAMVNMARLYLITGQAELAEMQISAAEKLVGSMTEAENRVDQRGLILSIREYRKLISYILGRFTDVAQTITQNLAEQQFFVDRARREHLPVAASQSIARRLANTNGLSLIEILVEANRPGLGGYDRLAQSNFRGNPFFLPLFDEYVMMNYRNQQFAEGELHLQLALVYFEQGDNVRASKQFRQVLQSIPANPPSQFRSTAMTYLKQMQNR